MASSTHENNLTNLFQKAKDLVNLLTPITMCVCIVACSVSGLEFYNEQSELKKKDFILTTSASPSLQLKQTFYNVLYYLGLLTLIAVLGIGCCKLRWYKLMFGCLMTLTSVVLIFIVVVYTSAFCITLNMALDYLTLVLLTWNIVIAGIMTMFWLAPVQLKQFYLILLAAQLALLLVMYLPYWTNWTLLITVAVWDIITVLWTYGPVNILIKEILKIKGDLNIPVLVYSTNGMEMNDCVDVRHINCANDNMGITLEAFEEENTAECSMPFDSYYAENDFCNDSDYLATDDTSLQIYSELKLGLADFIFYSVLIGQTKISCNWTTTLACFVAILIGMSFTFFLLFKFQKDLPALPLSVGLGLLFTVSASTLLSPLMDILALKQIFI